ncbi:MAG: putative thymidylate kinase [Parcubacteria group bacterium GW2011_GWF2_44_7]|nr:MAG: putative thymidylate kinase [Parcubacteria group bacterium GW2011_GWF2_44_7]
MKKNKTDVRQGKFIVFEGLDGSGQSTQIGLLDAYLKSKGVKTHLTTEPTNNIIGGLIRGILTHQWSLSNTGIQLLYCADRAHHLESEVLPAMAKGNVVISSRYFFSTIAYGSLDNDTEWLKKINEKFILPDMTFFIKVSPKVCMRRINGSRFRTEFFEKEKKLKKIYQAYLRLGESKEYKNFYVINGEQAVEEVSGEIKKIIDKIF